MYRILVRAGARPAGSKVTVDGIGELTVGHWQNVDEHQAEMFRLMHPSGKRPTLIQAFEGNPDVEVETVKKDKAPESPPPVAPSGDKGAADGSGKTEEKN